MTPKEKKAVYDKAYRIKNKEKRLQAAIKWNIENKESRRISSRKHWLKKTYQISPEEWDNKFEKQKGCCSICGRHQSEFKRQLSVDHNHITGEVRDLLCTSCNQAFGYVNEDINILEKMIAYAKRFSSN